MKTRSFVQGTQAPAEVPGGGTLAAGGSGDCCHGDGYYCTTPRGIDQGRGEGLSASSPALPLKPLFSYPKRYFPRPFLSFLVPTVVLCSHLSCFTSLLSLLLSVSNLVPFFFPVLSLLFFCQLVFHIFSLLLLPVPLSPPSHAGELCFTIINRIRH